MILNWLLDWFHFELQVGSDWSMSCCGSTKNLCRVRVMLQDFQLDFSVSSRMQHHVRWILSSNPFAIWRCPLLRGKNICVRNWKNIEIANIAKERCLLLGSARYGFCTVYRIFPWNFFSFLLKNRVKPNRLSRFIT